MKTFRKIIELLTAIETVLERRKATKRATRAAFRIAVNGCRI